MGQFSLTHLLILALILLVFFGPSKLPQLGQSMGKAIRGFKKGLSSDDDADSRDVSQQLDHQKTQKPESAKQKQDQNQS